MELLFRHPVYYNSEIDMWIDEFLRRQDDEVENMNNIRIAELTSWEELKQYEEQKDKGCCSRFDIETQHPKSGRRFRIGFNYGH